MNPDQPSPAVVGTHSPDGNWWWDGRSCVPAVSEDGRWWWNGSAWQQRQKTVPELRPLGLSRRVWTVLAITVAAIAYVLLLAHGLSLLHDVSMNGNIPGQLLLVVLAVSLTLWVGGIALGWFWRRSHPFLLLLVPPIWILSYYGSLVGVCPSCQWNQGAHISQASLGNFEYDSYRVNANAQFAFVADGSLWLPDLDGNAVWTYDPKTGAPTGLAGTDQDPFVGLYEGGKLWITSPITGRLYEVDPNKRMQVGSFKVGPRTHALFVVAGARALWISNAASDQLARFDLDKREVVDTIAVGHTPGGVVAAFGSIWVANYDDNSLSRVDPATDKVVNTIPVGKGPTFLIAAYGSIWSSSQNGNSVSRINPNTGSVAEIPVGKAPVGLAEADGYIWVANVESQDVSLIDPAQSQLVATLKTGVPSYSFAVDGDTVWLVTYEANVLGRFRPR